jgi:hypothetical protein
MPASGMGSFGRIDLYHIYWSCPAATKLRQILYLRWKVAGLAGGEHDIFSLALSEIPKELIRLAGGILADGVTGLRATHQLGATHKLCVTHLLSINQISVGGLTANEYALDGVPLC